MATGNNISPTPRPHGNRPVKRRSTSTRATSARPAVSRDASGRSAAPRTTSSSRVSNRTSTASKTRVTQASQIGISDSLWGAAQQSGKSGGAASDIGSRIISVLATILGALGRFLLFALRKLLQGLLALARFIITGPNWVRVTAALLVVVGGFCLVDAVSTNGKIYQGVKVGTLDVSGLTVEQAKDALDQNYAVKLTEGDVTIYGSDQAAAKGRDAGEDNRAASADNSYWTVNADSLQASFDSTSFAQTAYEIGRSEGGIVKRVSTLFAGTDIPVTASFNHTSVEELARKIDKVIGEPLQNCTVYCANGVATPTEGHDGNMINRVGFVQKLSDALIGDNNAADSFVAECEFTPMQINRETAQSTADHINAVLQAGMRLTYGSTVWEADARTLADYVVCDVQPTNDWSYELVPAFDTESTKSALLKHLQVLSAADSGAVITLNTDNEGVITVSMENQGTMPLVSSAVSKMTEALVSELPDEGMINIQVDEATIPESMTVDEAIEYGIVACIAEYETEYTEGVVARNHNIHLVSDLLSNSVIKANGGIWSFNQTAGDCNEEKGFMAAGAIVGDETVDEIGGGICQVATTVFNAVYDAGFPVTQRSPHSFYLENYPLGRDAAVSWPDLDLKWKNDSNSDVLLRMSYTDSTVTAKLYGINPGYRVSTETGQWQEGPDFQTVTQKDPELASGSSYVKQSGTKGGQITVVRTVTSEDGALLHEDEFHSDYSAKNKIVVEGTG